jgi:hypothetical protein
MKSVFPPTTCLPCQVFKSSFIPSRPNLHRFFLLPACISKFHHHRSSKPINRPLNGTTNSRCHCCAGHRSRVQSPPRFFKLALSRTQSPSMVFATPYDMAMTWNFNGLGYTLIALATAWTTVLAGGMVFLLINRGLPFLRIRSVPLAISAVALLHVYWVLCLLAYVLNGNFPCATEFWIMSIYLPLGIALFQATNTQLLHVAALQSEIASTDQTLGEPKQKKVSCDSWRRPLAKWKSATATKRTMTCIAIGMALQVSKHTINLYFMITNSVS